MLTDEQKTHLEQDISIEELAIAVKEMARNKTPGTSGFQVNMYGMFWTKLKTKYLQLFNLRIKKVY